MSIHWTIKSLGKVNAGNTIILNSMHLNVNVQRHLQILGIIPGVEITILQGGSNSSYLIEVNGSRIMLDWDTVKCLRVKIGV